MSLAPLDAAGTVTRWVQNLAPARQLAEVIADTDFVPKAMRGKPDAVTAAIMYGDELGLGPMQSLQGIDVVDGHPRPSAELARALAYRAGHTFTVHEASGTRVRVSGLRAGRPESERVYVEWTTDMARAAGLLNRPNWRSYPRAMLMARATGDLCRIVFPDVIKGLSYVNESDADAEVLDQWAPPTPEVADPVAPTAPAIQRRTRPGVTRPIEDVPVPGVSDPDPLPPEAPAERDPDRKRDGPEPMRENQRRAIFGAFGRVLGPDADRTQRLALCSAILGRDVDTSNSLTEPEAYELLAWLHELASGAVSWSYDPSDGIASVWRVSESDPDPPVVPPDPWLTPPRNVAQGDDPTEDPWSDLGGGSGDR